MKQCHNVAMEAAYASGAPWLNAVISYLEINVEMIRDTLSNIFGIELVEPEGAFITMDELYTFLRNRAKWLVTRGHSFAQEGNGFARVNIACTRAKL